MKTIKKIAEELGVSRQFVYKRVADCKLSLEGLTVEKKGNQRFFDDDAVAKITECCKRGVNELSPVVTVNDSVTVDLENEKRRVTELTAELGTANATINDLRERLEESRQRIDQLERELREERENASSERGRLLDQLASMTEALKASSVINASLIATNKRGLIQRIKDFLPSKTQN